MKKRKDSPARLALLVLARTMIDEVGLTGFSLRGLARKKGCSAPSIYEHFRSLDEIFSELRQQEEQHLSAALEKTNLLFDNPVEAARSMIKTYIEFFDGETGRFEIFFNTTKTLRNTIDDELPTGSSYTLLVNVMKRIGVESGCKEDKSQEWAFTAWSYSHGVCVLRANFLSPLESELEPLIEAGTHVLIDGIVANANR